MGYLVVQFHRWNTPVGNMDKVKAGKKAEKKAGRNIGEKVGGKTKTKDKTDKKDATGKKDTPVSSSKNEIDDLFSRKKPSTDPIAETNTSKKTIPTIPPPASLPSDDDDWTDSKGARRRRRPTTDEGYPIFTATEMKIGLGGDTPECPFDCSCCY